MYKDVKFKAKFQDLQELLPYLIEAARKDLKNEHLRKDPYFAKKYFTEDKNPLKASLENWVEAYKKGIQEEENGEDLAEYIATRWLMQEGDVYHFFEEKLKGVDENFTELEAIEAEKSQEIIDAALGEFGAIKTYLFSVLNSVVFPNEHFTQLRNRALEEKELLVTQEAMIDEQESFEKMQENYEQLLARQADRYEKKILGLQKKYVTDTEQLKKQLATLQRKLHGTKTHA